MNHTSDKMLLLPVTIFRNYGWPARVLMLVIIVFLAAGDAIPAGAPDEYQVKAAFLYNFAKFVEWPGEAHGSQKPFVICILGKNPFGHALTGITGKTVRGRQVEVKHISRVDDTGSCSIVFISESEEYHLSYILESLASRSILTVGDQEQFAAQGGMIGMSIRNETVKFDINLGAAQQARLRMNPQLLKLARNVIPGRK